MRSSVYFSPTGKTEEVVEHIGSRLITMSSIDISRDIQDYFMEEDDFCLVGVPSFGGRVPELAVKRLQQFHGNKTPAAIVVTYGNRAYDDTLRELKDVLEMQGFVCIAAAAFVTEHSIIHKFGAGRPNDSDYTDMERFAYGVNKVLKEGYKSVDVPGKFPYKERHVVPMKFQTTENCVGCGYCAISCPVHAISIDNTGITDYNKCISCMRCVSICPVQGRKCDPLIIEQLTEKLQDACSTDKDNSVFGL